MARECGRAVAGHAREGSVNDEALDVLVAKLDSLGPMSEEGKIWRDLVDTLIGVIREKNRYQRETAEIANQTMALMRATA